ncbi:MAG: TolC family protein [Gammaproteobacteria bacterium]
MWRTGRWVWISVVAKAVTRACALLALAGEAHALTEQAFIEKVLAQDKLLEEAQIGLDIKKIELDASRDNYRNWKLELSADAAYRHNDLDRYTTSARAYDKKRIGYPKKIGVSVEKRFLSNPGSMTAGISRGKGRDLVEQYKFRNPTPAAPEFEHDHTTTQRIRYKYPLLKHDGNADSLKTYRRNILDLQEQQLVFFEIKEDFLEDRLEDYLDWVLHHRQAQIDREFLEKHNRLNPENAADSALLKSAVYRIEQDNIKNQADLQAIRKKLAVLLDDESILTETPGFDFGKRIALFGGNLPAYLRARNRDLARIDIDLALKKIDLGFLKNQRLPSLNFSIAAERTLHSGSTRTTTLNDDRLAYVAALEFTYPLGGSITNRAALQIAHLAERKLQIAYQEKLQDLLADIQSLQSKLTLDEPRLLGAIDAAAQSARIERQNHLSGQSSFRDVLQAYRDWRETKIDHIENVIDYQKDSIEYDNLLDRMLESP